MNLGITIKITLMPIGKILKHITIETQTKKETEEVKTRAPIEITHNSTKIEHTR